MYLGNTVNMVQALDAATGELIWENQVGPDRSDRLRRRCATCAIYRRQGLSRDHRRAAGGARCPHRQGGLGRRPIADRSEGLLQRRAGRSSSRARSSRGCRAAIAIGTERCYISAYDAATGKLLWKFHTVARTGRTGRRHVGQAARHDARRRRDVDRGQLRSRSRSHLLGHRAGQAVDAGEPRHERQRRRALHRVHGGAAQPTTARSRGTTSTCRASRSISTRCSSACSSTSARRRRSSRSARPACCGSSIARPGKFLGHKETVFQNVFTRIDPEDRRPDLSRRHHRAEDRPVDPVVPEHRGRTQLAGDELSPRPAAAGDSAQPVVHGDRRAQGGVRRGLRRHGGRRAASSRCRAPTATSASSPPTT